LYAKVPVAGDAELCTLFRIIETVSPIISRGQIYEMAFTPEHTPKDAMDQIESTLLQVYTACAELLADANQQFSTGTAK